MKEGDCLQMTQKRDYNEKTEKYRLDISFAQPAKANSKAELL
jgi:hypothetical protein